MARKQENTAITFF